MGKLKRLKKHYEAKRNDKQVQSDIDTTLSLTHLFNLFNLFKKRKAKSLETSKDLLTANKSSIHA